MSQHSFDKEFLQRLRRVAKERGIKLVLDKSRLADPAYADELRAQHPLNTTEAQWRLACDIRDVTGLPLGLREATNAFRCSRYIDQNQQAFSELVPTKEQRSYAYKVARRYRVDVPRDVLLSKTAYAEWILTFSKPEVEKVLDIIELLGFGSGRIRRIMEEQGFEDAADENQNWTQSTQFINWAIETHAHRLNDPAAAFEAKRKEAKEMLRRTAGDRFSTGANYGLDDSVMDEIAAEVEAEEDIIVD